MLEQAIEIVIESGKASTSYLQRRMKIGYSRAARIVDMLEEMGIIGPQNGSKPRGVLIDEWPQGGGSVVEEAVDDEESSAEKEENLEEDFEEGHEDEGDEY